MDEQAKLDCAQLNCALLLIHRRRISISRFKERGSRRFFTMSKNAF